MPIDHVSVPMAAKMLGKHPETLRRWIRDGKVSVIHFPSGQIGVPRRVIEKILATSTASLHTYPHH
jgi:predicted site-specific integrase-resolvase